MLEQAKRNVVTRVDRKLFPDADFDKKKLLDAPANYIREPKGWIESASPTGISKVLDDTKKLGLRAAGAALGGVLNVGLKVLGKVYPYEIAGSPWTQWY